MDTKSCTNGKVCDQVDVMKKNVIEDTSCLCPLQVRGQRGNVKYRALVFLFQAHDWVHTKVLQKDDWTDTKSCKHGGAM